MIRDGYKRKNDEDTECFAFKYTNVDVLNITKSSSITDIVSKMNLNYIAHLCRRDHTFWPKKLLFMTNTQRYHRNIWRSLSNKLDIDENQLKKLTQNRNDFAKFVNRKYEWRIIFTQHHVLYEEN